MSLASHVCRWTTAVAVAGLVAGEAVSTGLAADDTFPTRPINLIVPFPPGGPSDVLARTLAQAMSTNLGQPIVVENVAGASGTIGLTKLTRSPPDGYTIGFGTVGTHVANVALYKNLPYKPVEDFQPLGLAGSAPTLLLAKPTLPASNLAEFIAYADANRGKVTYGSAGVGSISHFACVLLLSALKENITHVPYRGVAPAMNDLVGGHIDVMCDQTTTALAQVTGGQIKALSVLTDQTLPQLPKLATAARAGYADVNIRSWNAFFAPKATPAAIIERLNRALRAAVADTSVQRQMQAVGVDLPKPEDLAPGAVTEQITLGLKRDVPALRMRGETLD